MTKEDAIKRCEKIDMNLTKREKKKVYKTVNRFGRMLDKLGKEQRQFFAIVVEEIENEGIYFCK